jgi:phosphoglycolate phosphatase
MSEIILPNTKINDIKMIIFDKDGTLIDIHHYWCSMIKFRAEFFTKSLKHINKQNLYNDLVDGMGIDLTANKMKSLGPVGIKPREFIIDIALKIISKYSDIYTRQKVIDIFAQVDEYSKTQLSKIVKPLAGTVEILNLLKENNIIVSIATTDLSSRAIITMKELNIEHFFTDIVGGDSVNNAKPHPDLVELIASKNNIEVDNILVVGDSIADLNMAKNAGCRFLAVKTGLCNEEFEEKSDYIVDDLTQVKI